MNGTSPQYFGGLAADSHGTDDERPPLVLLHGLTYDRRQWGPVLHELARIDPGRRVLALDLPGHGDSPRRDSYQLEDVAALVHQGVADAGLDSPVLVGHSVGAVLATNYAADHPTHTVVNVDQPLLPGGFAELLREFEPVLRSPDYLQVWNSLLARMHLDVLPQAAQELVRTATTPRQDLLLGYWNELMVLPAEQLLERRTRELTAIRSAGTGYHFVTATDPAPAYRNWLQAALPELTMTVLPNSGHFVHLAHPAELARILAGVTRT